MRNSKSCGATHPQVAGQALLCSLGPPAVGATASPALPPFPALEAAMDAADQVLPQRRCTEAPACPAPNALCATSSCPVDPLHHPG